LTTPLATSSSSLVAAMVAGDDLDIAEDDARLAAMPLYE
jgi:hypothetical protein